MDVYCIANGKGGSGKTTTALHLARYLAAQGRPPLVWGLDDVGGITRALRPGSPRPTGADVLAGRAPLQAAASSSGMVDGVLVVPESPELREVADSLTLRPAGVFAVSAALNKAQAWIGDRPVILDTPGSLGTLTKSALLAATRLVLAANPAQDNIDGIVETLDAAHALAAQVRAGLPAAVAAGICDPQVAGVIVVRVRHGVVAHNDALAAVRELSRRLRSEMGVVPLAEGKDADARLARSYDQIFDFMWGGL